MSKKRKNINLYKESNTSYEKITYGNMTLTLKYCTAVPEVSKAEDDELLKDIEMRGFLTPVFIDEFGNVIDGWRKLKIAVILHRTDLMIKVISGLTEAEKWKLAEDLNFHRRQLPPDDIRKIMARNRERIPELALSLRLKGNSYRQIGDQLGISTECARQAIIKEAVTNNKNDDLPPVVIGKDGKKRKAKMPRKSLAIITASSPSEARRAIEVCSAISPGDLPNKTLNIKRAERIVREKENERLRQQEMYDYHEGSVELMLGDFIIRGQEIEDNSVHLIMTDLPYEQKALPLWEDLGILAKRVLKPGAVLISFCCGNEFM